MGVKSASNTLFLITAGVGGKGEDTITSQDLHHVSKKFSSKDETVAIVDCSWIAQKFGRISNDAVGAVMKLLLVLKGLGYRVIPVTDSNQKNNAKRIRNDRDKIYMKKTVDLKYCRVQLDKLRRQLSNTNLTLEDRAEIQKVGGILEKSVTSKEKGTFKMDTDFIDNLQDEVLNNFALGGNSIGGIIEKVVVASYQADAYIASIMQNTPGCIIFGNDSDFFYLSGIVNCIQIKNFAYGSTKRVGQDNLEGVYLHKIEIIVPTEVNKEVCVDTINTTRQVQRRKALDYKGIGDPEWPLLQLTSEFDSPLLRGLIAITLGCDCYPDGVGIGPGKLYKFLQGLFWDDVELTNDVMVTSLTNWLVHVVSQKWKLQDELFFHTLAYAFIGEPCMSETEKNLGKYKYLCGTLPQPLPNYLHQFSNIKRTRDKSVFQLNDTTIKKCPGIMGNEHLMLSAEKMITCSKCKGVYCTTCVLKRQTEVKEFVKESLCAACWQMCRANEIVGGNRISDEASEVKSLIVSEKNMRERILNLGVQIPKECAYIDVMDLYELYVNTDYSKFRTLEEDVSGPRYSPSDFANMNKQVMLIDFRDGGRFISSSKIKDYQLPNVISLFARIVSFSEEKFTSFDDMVFECLPAMIIKFCNDARFGHGYRMCERTVRHSMDSRNKGIFGTIGELMIIDGQFGVHLHTQVPASMKKQYYTTSTAFSKSCILSTSCSCAVGSQQGSVDRFECVHCCVPIYDLCLALFDGLAEHILVELDARIGSTKYIYENTIKNQMIADIKLLIQATGLSQSSNTYSLKEVLSKFTVGTERSKSLYQVPVNKELVGPVRNLLNISFKREARKRTRNSGISLEKVAKKLKYDTVKHDKGVDLHTDDYDIMIEDEFGNFFPVICEYCSKIETRNRCTACTSDGRYSINGSDRVCGRAMCVECAEIKCGEKFNLGYCSEHRDCYVTKQKKDQECKKLPIFSPDYCGCFLLSTVSGVDVTKSKFIGHKLFTGRYVESINSKSDSEMIVLKRGYDSMWHELKEKASKRNARSREKCGRPKKAAKRDICIIKDKEQLKSNELTNYIDMKLVKCLEKESFLTPTKLRSRTCAPVDSLESSNLIDPNSIKKETSNVQRDRTNWKLSSSYTCFMKDCLNTNLTDGCNWTTIPNYHDHEDIKRKKVGMAKKWAIGNRLRKKVFDCCGKGKKLYSNHMYKSQLRYCSHHHIEYVKLKVDMKDYGFDEEGYVEKVCSIPSQTGKKSSLNNPLILRPGHSTPTGGVGVDRLAKSTLLTMRQQVAEGKPGADSNLLLMKSLELTSIEICQNNCTCRCCTVKKNKEDITASNRIRRVIHPAVSFAAGFPEFQNDLALNNIDATVGQLGGMVGSHGRYEQNLLQSKMNLKPEDRPPVVRLGAITDSEIKRRTGFKNEAHLLLMIFIGCNADMNKMIDTSTVMTWYEEWFFFFEMLWGKNLVRWVDAESKQHYGIKGGGLRTVFDNKLRTILNARDSWPHYATYEEDKVYRNEYWHVRYTDERVVMWDNTNIPSDKFGNADLQAATFSKYYNMNCCKGGVFLQTCGWMGTHHLWSGSVTDTEYMISSTILDNQMVFAEHDLINGLVKPFLNVLDKGYRITLECKDRGGQRTLQPDFAKSDRKFKAVESLSSSTVATDRSGNERVVRYSKASGYVRRGKYGKQDLKRIDDAWLAWGFMCNFLYEPVL